MRVRVRLMYDLEVADMAEGRAAAEHARQELERSARLRGSVDVAVRELHYSSNPEKGAA